MGILIEFNYKGKSECGEGQDRVSSTLQIPLNISSSGAASRENVIFAPHSAGDWRHTPSLLTSSLITEIQQRVSGPFF